MSAHIDRILKALCCAEKTPQQLADELFVHRSDIRQSLADLHRHGYVHRKFIHNEKSGLPDYVYSSVPYPSKYRTNFLSPSSLLDALGAWDATDITRLKI